MPSKLLKMKLQKRKRTNENPQNEEISLKDGDCNCEWMGNDDLQKQVWGVCENEVRFFRDDLIHWRETNWHRRCAFEFAKSELDRIESTNNKSNQSW